MLHARQLRASTVRPAASVAAAPTVVVPVSVDPAIVAARREAATKLRTNHRTISEQILRHAGLSRYVYSPFGGTVRSFNGYPATILPAVAEALDFHLDRLTGYLLTGEAGPKAGTPDAAAVGAAALALFASRAALPLGLSEEGQEQLSQASATLLSTTY